MLEIDGSYLEGGGQILRNALSLSCILGKPIRITKIRANRPNPGLSNQHLYGLNLLQQITGARVTGNYIKSTAVDFEPSSIKSGRYVVDTRTAAAISLVMQAALPVLIFGDASSELELIGGTNVSMAPQVDYMSEVFRSNLELFGVSFDFELLRRGYYPRGGGRCRVSVPPVHSIHSAQITHFGSTEEVCGWCYVAGRLPLYLAQDMQKAAECELRNMLGPQLPINIEAYKESTDMARDNGSGLILKAVTSTGCTLGASALGEKQVDGQALGLRAAKQLSNRLMQNTCIDEHTQDQLILFMALADGLSQIRTCALTNHTRTAIHVAECMAGVKFHIEEDATKDQVTISCRGIGFHNKKLKK